MMETLSIVCVLVTVNVYVLCRLSYHQRIVEIVPPTFAALIPAEPVFVYKYADESACKPLCCRLSTAEGIWKMSRSFKDGIFSCLSVVAGLRHVSDGLQRHQEPSVQWGDSHHPQRYAQPQPGRRRRLFICFNQLFNIFVRIYVCCFYMNLNVTWNLCFFPSWQTKVRASTRWKWTFSCRRFFTWQPNPSATHSVLSASKFTSGP